jgi:hypothetical protein
MSWRKWRPDLRIREKRGTPYEPIRYELSPSDGSGWQRGENPSSINGSENQALAGWHNGSACAEHKRNARLQRRVRFGFDDIFDKLAAEKKGINELLQKTRSQQKNRISRLLLFSNDGAERLYRHIEQALIEHHLRILGCQLDVDSKKLGQLITGSSAGVKVILVEHKDAVSDVLRSLVGNRE